MFQSFITSLEACEKNKRTNSDRLEIKNSEEITLKNQVKNLIEGMPAAQMCAQAALNIGLPTNLLEFNKLLKKIEVQTSINNLNFTVTQLKALHKESLKLKKFANKEVQISQSPEKKKLMYQAMKSNSESLMMNDQQKKENHFQQKLASALKDQINFRIKVKNFYSTQKLEKKDSYIKKIKEKAKYMNKKVAKVYKIIKQKQKNQIQHFKIPSVDMFEQKDSRASRELKIRRKKISANFGGYSVLQSNIEDFEQNQVIQKRYKTAETGRRFYDKKQMDQCENKENQSRFFQMREKQTKIRERKRQIQAEKEDTAIIKLIKKHEKLNLISTENQKKTASKTAIKNKNQKRKSLNDLNLEMKIAKEEKPDLQTLIKNRCEEKLFKKQLILQQKVNKIRQQLKVKEERIYKHRLNIQKQHQNIQESQEEYLKTYNQKIRNLKQQNEMKHQLKIRNRFQTGLQKERQQKMLQNIPKMNERQLKKQLENIKGSEHSQSQKHINGP